MKIVTWNVNGYRSITGQNPSKRFDKVTKENKLFSYIEREKPDILCVQETKSDLEQIDEALRAPEGYESWFNSCKVKKGYSGVAVFSRVKPASVGFGVGIPEFDDEGRIIEADFGDFILYNIYFPKGYTDHERLDYKMRFYDALFAYINKQVKAGRKIIVCGDYNTAHKEIDLARPKENVNVSGFLPVEREKFDEVLAVGFVDAFRVNNSEGGWYSWWSQRGRARENNIGWRIDYHLITENLVGSLKEVTYRMEEQGSDHCPVVMEMR